MASITLKPPGKRSTVQGGGKRRSVISKYNSKSRRRTGPSVLKDEKDQAGRDAITNYAITSYAPAKPDGDQHRYKKAVGGLKDRGPLDHLAKKKPRTGGAGLLGFHWGGNL